MDIMECKNIEFKDLERLTSSELYEELTTVFGDFSFAKIKNAKAYYEFFKRRTPEGKPALIVYRVKDAIFNLLEDEEVSIRNIEILSSISKLLEMTRGSTECDENYVYGVFKFCKKYGLESYHDIKDLILGYGYYNMYFKSNTESYVKYDLLDFLATINSKDEVKKLVACCKEFSNISNIFRYELQKRYPNNTAGLLGKIKHCFGSIRKHFDLDNDDTEDKFVIPDNVKNALYGMACLYEKLVVNIGEGDSFDGNRFADDFLREFGKIFAEDKDFYICRKDAYKLDDLLKLFKSDKLGEENTFSRDELKDYLMCHIENFYMVREDITRSMYEKTKRLIDYANSGSRERVSFKNFIHNNGVRKTSILYRPEHTVEEEIGLLMGETFGETYVEDGYKDNKYRYYLLELEMRELFPDVKIGGINPDSVNKLISDNIGVCNNLSVARLETMLVDMIESLYEVYGIDDGEPKYLNNKIEELEKMGFDVKNLIDVDNLTYICGNSAVVKNINGDDSFWYSFKENIIRLSAYYDPSEISEMIKHNPKIVFSDHNELEKLARAGKLMEYVDSEVGYEASEQI